LQITIAEMDRYEEALAREIREARTRVARSRVPTATVALGAGGEKALTSIAFNMGTAGIGPAASCV
jgi:hypothetical protein